MSDPFSYPLDNDDDIFRQGIITLGSRPIEVTACTVAGSHTGTDKKANEDAFSVIKSQDGYVFSVFDGCSSQGNFEWIDDKNPARYASHFVKERLEAYQGTIRAPDLLGELNEALLKETQRLSGNPALKVMELPSTTAAIAHLDLLGKELSVSYLGDSFCVVFYKNGESKLLTVDLNQAYERAINDKITTLSQEAHVSPRLLMSSPKVKELFDDRVRTTHNRADGEGQGIVNGDPTASKYIRFEQIPLTNVQSVLIATDGLLPPGFKKDTEQDQAKILSLVLSGGLKNLLSEKRATENSDPEWKLIRTKHSDDATGIYLNFKPTTAV